MCLSAGSRDATGEWTCGEKLRRKAILVRIAWCIVCLPTLKTTQQVTTTGTQRLPQSPSKAAIWLFMRRFNDLDEQEQNDLMAFRQASSTLATTYDLVQDFLQMVRERQGDRLEEWLTQVEKSALPELESFAHGVQLDHAAVQAGLTLSINNGQVEGHVTKIKLIKRIVS